MLKLTRTRRKLAYMCCWRLPSRSWAMQEWATAAIEGKSFGLISPTARHASQISIRRAKEAAK